MAYTINVEIRKDNFKKQIYIDSQKILIQKNAYSYYEK